MSERGAVRDDLDLKPTLTVGQLIDRLCGLPRGMGVIAQVPLVPGVTEAGDPYGCCRLVSVRYLRELHLIELVID